jgi:hypothetical protein
MPCFTRDILQAGMGQPRVREWWEEGAGLKGRVQMTYAGRVLDEREVVLEGDLLIEAATQLLMDGKLLPETAGETLQSIEAWNLHCRLHPREGEPVEPRQWMRDRLKELGIASGEDLEALLPTDLDFPGLSRPQREALDRQYPRRIHLGDLVCDVEYHPRRREVILVKAGGTRSQPPPIQYLPRWPGWKVLFKDRQRTVLLRE